MVNDTCTGLICKNQVKSSLYSPYYAEACNELRGPSPRLSAWSTQYTSPKKRRNDGESLDCVDLTDPGIEPQTSRTDIVRLATELTAGYLQCFTYLLCLYLLYWAFELTRT